MPKAIGKKQILAVLASGNDFSNDLEPPLHSKVANASNIDEQ